MLDINNVTFSYKNKPVLEDLDWKVKEGEIHGLVGLNGSGKTTLFHLIYGFLKPRKGEISMHRMGFNPENTALLETENYFYSRIRGMEYLELFGKNKAAIDIVRLNELFQLPLQKRVDQYSSGMKKKLALMGCLLLDKPLILLDEPFNGLDMESSHILKEIINELHQGGKTIIISSHILESLTGICDRISFLHEGKIRFSFERNRYDQLANEIFHHLHEQKALIKRLFTRDETNRDIDPK